MRDGIDEIARLFVEESLEGLDVMESGMLGLDLESPDAETIHAIFRAAHSLKGGAGSFGYVALSEFAHEVEAVLDRGRSHLGCLTDDHIEVLLRSVDCMRGMVADIQNGVAPTIGPQAENLIEHLLDHVAMMPAPIPYGREEMMEQDLPEDKPEEQPEDGPAEQSFAFTCRPSASIYRDGADPLSLFEGLRELGALEVTLLGADALSFGAFDISACHLHWKLKLTTTADRQAVESIFAPVANSYELSFADEAKAAPIAVVPTAKAERAAPEKRDAKPRPPTRPAESATIRVNTGKVDALLDLVGELVINQSMLSHLADDFTPGDLPRLRVGLTQLDRYTRQLQESVMAIRMLPIGSAFARFPRLVRDASHALGKEVDFRISGEKTEVDKTVLEKIGDPLVHLVRNSLDHGLEMPEVRVAAGKPEVGAITMDAYQESGSIVVEICDDGRGIDKTRVLARARERGLVGPDEDLTDDRIYNLIFQPGFSTSETVTDLSGRGVGLDVVRRNISDLGGDVTVDSVTGSAPESRSACP